MNYINSYGYIKIKLREVVKDRGISKNKFSHLAEMQHKQINKYYNNTITLLDIDVLARICNALDCTISDILEYVPKESQD